MPGTYLLTRLFARPGFAFGLYFTLGQGGAVAGPLLYLWIARDRRLDWRAVWIVSAAAILLTSLLAALFSDTAADVARRGRSRSRNHRRELDGQGGAEDAASSSFSPPPTAPS